MSVIILFMAVAFADMNGLSSVRTTCVLDGSFAEANDVAITDEVTTSETTRLRMKERENKTIVTSGCLPDIACADRSAAPALCFLDIFLKGRPTKHPAAQSRFRDALEHGGRPPASQLKTDLHF
jgi:hypothetical protein